MRQLAGMGMTEQGMGGGRALDQHGQGLSASELRNTATDMGRDRGERGTHHMETWNKGDLGCIYCWLTLFTMI